jgi:hypothetical protein
MTHVVIHPGPLRHTHAAHIAHGTQHTMSARIELPQVTCMHPRHDIQDVDGVVAGVCNQQPVALLRAEGQVSRAPIVRTCAKPAHGEGTQGVARCPPEE